MEKFWNIFWKVFGVFIILAFITGIVMGFVSNSKETAYNIIKSVFVLGLGICGVIGFIVVPIEMYITYRKEGGGTNETLI
ncbi:MAG: hypothetical protein LBP37_04435 [Spirochaetaceae bacterium]|jgi:hypothetical protein|nr:hypothetical protein [Spirochaetaceae bacterium]